MSYCRWSSDEWRCDLYCYEHVGGWWQIHVAGNRVVGDIPAESHAVVMDFLRNAERRPIGLPHDGESFEEPTLEAFLSRLLMLREAGYSFPDYVLDTVREEMSEARNV